MSAERSVEERAAPSSWAGRVWGLLRRHPYWTALIVLMLVVRVALPYVLRPVLEDQISALLNGRIEVDDVDLSLLRGEAVIEGVRIFEAENDGVASFAKLLANIRWTALPFGQAVVEEIHLLSPKVRIVREADGEINLARLPAPAEAAAPDEEEAESAEEAGGWPAGLTRLALEDATVTFTDRTVENFQDIEFDIELLQVERAAYGGPIYEDDGKVTLVAELAGAPLKVEADFASEILSATSTGNIHLRDLNVGLGSAYAAQMLGWSDLRGALDVDLDFAAESGDAESPRIALALRDFLIAVEGESEPALTWDSLDIGIQMADPQTRFVQVSEVRLTNPMVRIRPAEEQPLVLLSRMDRGAAAEAATDEATLEPPTADLEASAGAEAADGETGAATQAAREANGAAAAAQPIDAEKAAGAEIEPEVDTAEAPAPRPAAESAGEPEVAAVEEAEVAEPESPSVAATDAADAGEESAEPEVAAAAEAEGSEEPAPPGAAETGTEAGAAGSDAAADGAAVAASPAVAEREAAPAAVAGGAAPRWQLDKLVIDGARIVVEGPESTLEAGIDLELSGLTSDAGDKGSLVVKTAIEDGTLDVTGDIGIAPVSFDGEVDLASLSLPTVLAFVPEPRAKILRGGVARTDLDVSVLVAEGEDAPAVDASVSGTVGLSGLEVAGDDPKLFSFKWEDLDVSIDGIDVRGGVPAADGDKAPIRIAKVALKKPAFRGVRLENGSIALPPELAADGATDAAPSADDQPLDDEAADDVATAGDAAGGEVAESPMPGIELAKVRVTNGSLRIVDRAVRPEAKPGLKTFKLALDDVRMPERQIGKLHLKGVGLRGGEIEANGKLDGEATDIVLTIEKYRLVPYDPYAVTFSGYGIRRGMLSVESKVRLQGDDFDTHTKVIVHELGIKNTSGTTEFEDQIGVPVSLALALLKDTQGDIKLDVPVSGNRDETNIGIGGIVAQQLKRILVNAIASPLKLFGALGGGDEVGDFSAARIAFSEGEQTLSDEGRAQTEQLADLLRERPELAIHLDAKNSLGDVRAMQEVLLLEDLQARESVRGEFAEIRDYLASRENGEEAELPYHLEPILEEMLSHRRPPKSEVEALSASRVEFVRNLMVGELQVRPDQVIVEEHLSGGFVDGPAIVEAELGVVDGDEDDADGEEEESIG